MSRLFKKIQLPVMVQEYLRYIQPATDVSSEKQVQLLKMTHERLVYSFTAMPFVAVFAALFYGAKHNIIWMAVWAFGYCCAYFFSKQRARQFLQDELKFSAHDLLVIWRPKLLRSATFHGLALCAPFIITVSDPSFEFTTLWYLVIAAIIAGNATHQTPMLGIFVRFFNCSWNLATVLSVVAYPDHWQYITPMIFMFTAGIYRHALIAHKFFLQQVRLEESSTRLAEQFREAKNIAEEALSSKNRFLATASHDLRQPVHAMSMLLEAISQRNQDPSLTPALMDLRSSLRAMSLMFNSLLDLSKLESGAVAVEYQQIHLQAFLHEIAKLFDHDARDRQLQLRIHLPERAAYTLTDVNLLRQVMLNLMQNALRYTKRGGVLLALRKRGTAWQIEVCDTGIGVAKESQSSIYLPYFRQEHAWGIDSEGHGLGLSVVARCALLLKSPIGMASRLGRGSRFWISVPVLPANSAPQNIASQFNFPPAGEKSLTPINYGRCLVVEDDPQVSRAWLALMQSWGVEAEITSNSVEACASLQAGFLPDAILCDERLRAGESGFELLKVLLAQCPNARGAMISGEFNSPALTQAEEEGYLVLRKPVEISFIHDLLSRWLDRSTQTSNRL